MSRARSFPTVLIRAALLMAVMISAAGCPSSGDKPSSGESAGEPQSPLADAGRPEGKPPTGPEFPPLKPQESVGHEEGKPAASAEQGPDSGPSEGAPNPLRDPTAEPGKDAAAKPKAGTVTPPSKRVRPPFDPIKENGAFFVGWPKPKAALVITGRLDGYIEPCGCAGLDRMKGGLARRHTLFKTLRQQGWPVVGIDVGGIAKGFGRQAELKFQTCVEALRKMGYNAVGLGAGDLQLPAGELVAVAASVPGQQGLFVSANVGLFGFSAEVTPKTRVVEAGGLKFGITAVLGEKLCKQVRNDEIETSDPQTALAKLVPQLKKQADYLILLAYADVEESLALAKRFPEFDLVVTSGGAAEPPARPTPILGSDKALLIEVGEKGASAIVLGLYDDAKQPIRYQRVTLDSRYASSSDMKLLMAAYQDQLKAMRFPETIRPVPHPLKETNGRFVGSKKCGDCHDVSYRVWKKSKHSKAYETLVKLDPPRNFDPECVSCHVVGWHPTKYFPYETGYQSQEKTPLLAEAGCDNCHAPGEAHCIAELGTDVALQKKLREAVRITKAESADALSKKPNCFTCHDLDNSPDFDFDSYWPDVEHYEK